MYNLVLHSDERTSAGLVIEALTELPLRVTLCAIVWESRSSGDIRRMRCSHGAVGNIVRITTIIYETGPITLCEVAIYELDGRIALPRSPAVILHPEKGSTSNKLQ